METDLSSILTSFSILTIHASCKNSEVSSCKALSSFLYNFSDPNNISVRILLSNNISVRILLSNNISVRILLSKILVLESYSLIHLPLIPPFRQETTFHGYKAQQVIILFRVQEGKCSDLIIRIS